MCSIPIQLVTIWQRLERGRGGKGGERPRELSLQRQPRALRFRSFRHANTTHTTAACPADTRRSITSPHRCRATACASPSATCWRQPHARKSRGRDLLTGYVCRFAFAQMPSGCATPLCTAIERRGDPGRSTVQRVVHCSVPQVLNCNIEPQGLPNPRRGTRRRCRSLTHRAASARCSSGRARGAIRKLAPFVSTEPTATVGAARAPYESFSNASRSFGGHRGRA